MRVNVFSIAYFDKLQNTLHFDCREFYQRIIKTTLPNGTTGGVSYILNRKEGCSPTGQPSGWLFLFHNEGGF